MKNFLKILAIALCIGATSCSAQQTKIQESKAYESVCDATEKVVSVLIKNKYQPLFISGNGDGYATTVFVNLQEETAFYIRTENGKSCIIDEGHHILFPVPKGISIV